MPTFEPNKILNYNEESIVAELKRVYLNFFKDKQMTQNEFNLHSRVSRDTVVRYFGTWKDALKKADIPLSVTKRTPRISLIDIKSDLERVKKNNQSKPFSFLFYKQNGGKYDKKIKKRFGCDSWEDLLNIAVGISKPQKTIVLKPQKQVLTDEQLFSEIKRVWNILNRRPTYKEFRNNSSFGTSVYETRFGKWTKAIEEFCIKNEGYKSNPIGKSFKVTKELLLDELKQIKKEKNIEVLEYKDYIKYGGRYSIATFQNYFGSWKNSLQLVGIKPGSEWTKAPDKELLFDELQRVWEDLGRQPLYREWNELAKYTRYIYNRKFGGWNKAIHAFIDNREETSDDPGIKITEKEIVLDNIIEIINPENTNIVKTITMQTPRGVAPKLRFRVFVRDKFTCQYCKRTKEEDGVKLQPDHIIPYSKGGETVFENLITACWDCNIGKSDLLI